MNSETKFILGLVTLGAVIYFIGENKTHPVEVSTAPSRFESPITKLISLQDSMGIKPKEEKKQWYKYRVEIETIPEIKSIRLRNLDTSNMKFLDWVKLILM